MKTTFQIILLALLFSLPIVAGASVTPVAGGYQVIYDVNLPSGTSNDSDIEDVVVVEWNASGDFGIESGFAIAGRGQTRLKHTISFEPDSALVMGWSAGIPGKGDEKDHLVTLTNGAFVSEVTGRKWSEVFPGVPPEPRTGHNAMIGLLQAAGAGDADALDAISTWVQREAQAAAFDPAGGFRVLEWTIPTPIDRAVPVPVMSWYGLGLLAFGLLIMGRRFLLRRDWHKAGH